MSRTMLRTDQPWRILLMDNWYGSNSVEDGYADTIRDFLKLGQEIKKNGRLGVFQFERENGKRPIEIYQVRAFEDLPSVKSCLFFPQKFKAVMNEVDGAVAYFATDQRCAGDHQALSLQLGFYLGRRKKMGASELQDVCILCDHQADLPVTLPSNIKPNRDRTVRQPQNAINEINRMVEKWEERGLAVGPGQPHFAIDTVRNYLPGTNDWDPSAFQRAGYSEHPIANDLTLLSLGMLADIVRSNEQAHFCDNVRYELITATTLLGEFFDVVDRENISGRHRQAMRATYLGVGAFQQLERYLFSLERLKKLFDVNDNNFPSAFITESQNAEPDELLCRYLVNEGQHYRLPPEFGPHAADVVQTRVRQLFDDIHYIKSSTYFQKQGVISYSNEFEELERRLTDAQTFLRAIEFNQRERLKDCVQKMNKRVDDLLGKTFSPVLLFSRLSGAQTRIREVLEEYHPLKQQ